MIIFFSNNEVIIEWWENYKDSDNILKIMDIIKNSDEWNKFNSIVRKNDIFKTGPYNILKGELYFYQNIILGIE